MTSRGTVMRSVVDLFLACEEAIAQQALPFEVWDQDPCSALAAMTIGWSAHTKVQRPARPGPQLLTEYPSTTVPDYSQDALLSLQGRQSSAGG
jgi:hypothetical protein